jgi:hypothetical protein
MLSGSSVEGRSGANAVVAQSGVLAGPNRANREMRRVCAAKIAVRRVHTSSDGTPEATASAAPRMTLTSAASSALSLRVLSVSATRTSALR